MHAAAHARLAGPLWGQTAPGFKGAPLPIYSVTSRIIGLGLGLARQLETCCQFIWQTGSAT